MNATKHESERMDSRSNERTDAQGARGIGGGEQTREKKAAINCIASDAKQKRQYYHRIKCTSRLNNNFHQPVAGRQRRRTYIYAQNTHVRDGNGINKMARRNETEGEKNVKQSEVN